jgi:uncharacterized repeat protein (TIGR01451 family)
MRRPDGPRIGKQLVAILVAVCALAAAQAPAQGLRIDRTGQALFTDTPLRSGAPIVGQPTPSYPQQPTAVAPAPLQPQPTPVISAAPRPTPVAGAPLQPIPVPATPTVVVPSAAGVVTPQAAASWSVRVNPNPVIAPVGSEVILLASVQGNQGYLLTNERVEWSLAPGSVGHFVGVGFNGVTDWLFGNFRRGKVDNAYVIGTTSRDSFRLTRGTPILSDDVCVLAGQAWVSLTSPVEGSSFVTAYAPESPACDSRMGGSAVHWVDAQWQFPPPAISPVGSRHVFTTTVTRHSDHSPCAGWRVRYDVIDGPPAGFGPTGARSVEVETGPQGQASAEISQQEQVPGTNRIAIQIIRASGPCCPQNRPLVVAYGSVLKTWTAPQIAVRLSGPAVAAVGMNLTYQVTVSNPGDLPAEDVTVTDQLPDTLNHVSSNPPAEVAGRKLQWRLGRLGGRETRSLELVVRAETQGPVNHCVEAAAAGGLKARDCAATTAGAPEVSVKMTGPERVSVGASVTFDIVVTNRGLSPAMNLLLKDRFDEGLVHAVSSSPIKRELSLLGPGESKQIRVTFQATKPGQLCHTLEITGPGGLSTSAKGCVTAVEGPAPQQPPSATTPAKPPATSPSTPPATPPSTPPATKTTEPPAFGRPAISVEKTGPQSARIGDTAQFVIVVRNTGTQRLTKVTVVDRFDSTLEPTMASEGFTASGNELVWKLEQMAVGETVKLGAHYRCTREGKACNRVSATTQEAATAQAEACLEIRAAAAEPRGPLTTPPTTTPPQPPAKPAEPALPPATPKPSTPPPMAELSMGVADLRDPVATGKEVTYEIRITNRGTGADQQVLLTVSLPTSMQPAPLGTSGPSNARTEGQVIRFDPVAEIPVGQTLTYRIRVRTLKPGDVKVRAELSSRSTQRPLVVEEATQVF